MSVFDSFFSEEARAKRNPTPEDIHYNKERLQEERARTDFASVWPGVNVEHRGLRDGNVSQTYYEAYLKAMKEDNPSQGQFDLPNSGIVCFFDPDTGFLTMQGAMGSAVIHKDDLPKLVQGINGPRPPDEDSSSTISPPPNGSTYLSSSSNLTP